MLRVLLLVMVVMSAGYATDLKDLVKGVFEDLADFPSDVEGTEHLIVIPFTSKNLNDIQRKVYMINDNMCMYF